MINNLNECLKTPSINVLMINIRIEIEFFLKQKKTLKIESYLGELGGDAPRLD